MKYRNARAPTRIASGDGCPTWHYSGSRKHTFMFIYDSHIDIAQTFMSCELHEYYSLKHAMLEPP